MHFSVITPSFNSDPWIRCCVESVGDQDGVAAEHLIHDGCSIDGTVAYLRSEPRINAVIEKDQGMYDAINRGWRRAKGELVVHLNADEQLLPGALAAVHECFSRHPESDVVLAGALICGPDGSLKAYRKPVHPPLSVLLTSHHPIPSCAIFFRKSSFADRPCLYDPGFRLISDALLMIDVVRARKHITLLDQFTSVFTWTGENLGLCQSELALREYRYQMELAPRWLRVAKRLVRVGFHVRKCLAGHYFEGKISYRIYTPRDLTVRQGFEVARPSGVYRPQRTAEKHIRLAVKGQA